MHHLTRPEPGEYAAFQAPYIEATRGADLWPLMRRHQIERLEAGCGSLTDDEALHRYAPGKWSVKEVVGHITDAERVFAYRALRLSRGDPTPLPGFDENAYVAAANFNARTMRSLLDGFDSVRIASLAMLETLGPEHWTRGGTVNGSATTVRAIVHTLAGHVEHHLALLRERYGLRA